MKRREFLKLTSAAVATQALTSCGRDSGARRPNVLFFMPDQLRADVCSAYGGRNIRTPHFDRAAAEGALFENALSTFPLCTPYRGMLMTGRLPAHSGVVLNRVDLSVRQNPHCLGRVFGDAGYDTGYIGKWHLTAGRRKWIGLTEPTKGAVKRYSAEVPHPEFVPPGPHRLGFDHWEAYNYHDEFADYWFYRDEPERIEVDGFETDIQTDQAIAFMRARAESDRPFFLVVSPHPPHPPYQPELCPPGYLERIPKELVFRENVPAEHSRFWHPQELRCYLAMAQNTDDNFGRLLDFLDESQLARDTIVVFTSDHGEMHGSHGRVSKNVPYTEAVRVPLAVRWPDRIRPGRTRALQTPLDHMTTLCGLAGVEAPAEADGLDLSAHLQGASEPEREAVLMMNYSSHSSFFQTGTDWPEWRGVRTKRHTYVLWLDGSEELYDDEVDPLQNTNLAGAGGEALGHLRQRLDELLAQADDEFLAGNRYAEWYDDERELVRTALGPVR